MNRCRLFHDWPTWGDIQSGQLLRDARYVGDLFFQKRHCRRCNKVAVRRVNVPI